MTFLVLTGDGKSISDLIDWTPAQHVRQAVKVLKLRDIQGLMDEVRERFPSFDELPWHVANKCILKTAVYVLEPELDDKVNEILGPVWAWQRDHGFPRMMYQKESGLKVMMDDKQRTGHTFSDVERTLHRYESDVAICLREFIGKQVDGIPVIPGFAFDHKHYLRVTAFCPFCNKFHLHATDEVGLRKGRIRRIAHCASRMVDSYFVQIVGGVERG